MVEGAGLGASARAALMTRGFAEMTRLAVALGARPETLAGLSGLGDLSLTCNSAQSRNFALGRALGAGEARPAARSRGSRPRAPPASSGGSARGRAADRRRGGRCARGRDDARGRDAGAARPPAARGVDSQTPVPGSLWSHPEVGAISLRGKIRGGDGRTGAGARAGASRIVGGSRRGRSLRRRGDVSSLAERRFRQPAGPWSRWRRPRPPSERHPSRPPASLDRRNEPTMCGRGSKPFAATKWFAMLEPTRGPKEGRAWALH